MDGRIEGSFPGGPRRRDPDDPPPPTPPLRRVQDLERAASLRTRDLALRRRAARLRIGLVTALVLAFAAGLVLGLASHTTHQELTAAQESARAKDREVSREVNRVLLELWKMEDAEAARAGPRAR